MTTKGRDPKGRGQSPARMAIPGLAMVRSDYSPEGT